MWVKQFKDGSSEYGSDADIDAGKASWSHGRLDNIYCVDLIHNRQKYSLSVWDTNWHQFDRFHAIVQDYGMTPSYRVFRVIQAEVKECHVGMSVYVSTVGRHTKFELIDKSSIGSLFKIQEEHVGKWITVLVNHKEVKISISPKGSIK